MDEGGTLQAETQQARLTVTVVRGSGAGRLSCKVAEPRSCCRSGEVVKTVTELWHVLVQACSQKKKKTPSKHHHQTWRACAHPPQYQPASGAKRSAASWLRRSELVFLRPETSKRVRCGGEMLTAEGLGSGLGLLAFFRVFLLLCSGRVMCQGAGRSRIEPGVRGERHRGIPRAAFRAGEIREARIAVTPLNIPHPQNVSFLRWLLLSYLWGTGGAPSRADRDTEAGGAASPAVPGLTASSGGSSQHRVSPARAPGRAMAAGGGRAPVAPTRGQRVPSRKSNAKNWARADTAEARLWDARFKAWEG